MLTCKASRLKFEFPDSPTLLGSSESEIEEHNSWDIGFIIKDRYIINRYLGEGSFGRVLEARDTYDKKLKAIKIIKPIENYVMDAKEEFEILRRVNLLDAHNSSHIVRAIDAFSFENHYCIIFENLGKSLYYLLERNNFRGFRISEIKDFSRQLLISLNFMYKHKLTHTDLKPENILFVHNKFKFCNKRVLVI